MSPLQSIICIIIEGNIKLDPTIPLVYRRFNIWDDLLSDYSQLVWLMSIHSDLKALDRNCINCGSLPSDI